MGADQLQSWSAASLLSAIERAAGEWAEVETDPAARNALYRSIERIRAARAMLLYASELIGSDHLARVTLEAIELQTGDTDA